MHDQMKIKTEKTLTKSVIRIERKNNPVLLMSCLVPGKRFYYVLCLLEEQNDGQHVRRPSCPMWSHSLD